MSFRVITPPPQRKPQVACRSSPSMSAYGRSPSLGPTTTAWTTDDIESAKYARLARLLHWLRVGLTVLALLVSIAIIVCAALSLRAYSSSHGDLEWLLPLWPAGVDLRPIHAVLGCGIVTTVLSLVYLGAAFAPLPSKLHQLNLASSVLGSASFIVALFTAIFASVTSNNLNSSVSSGTLNSWTCKWQSFQDMAPADFNAICKESTAAVDMVILLVVFEGLLLIATGVGFVVDMKSRRAAEIRSGKSEVELV